ncbi:MAG: hypothetical protein D6763_08850 [Alphaproteobacteria bacterium]|nr:MAG: hypothetical protein D6763_08850 [Alphaproteobacteria bacterium]
MKDANRDRFDRLLRQAVVFGRRKVPPGLRSIVGLLFLVGGVFGFLPVLGFWMIPLGLALIALDIPPLRRVFLAWLRRRRHRRLQALRARHVARSDTRQPNRE